MKKPKKLNKSTLSDYGWKSDLQDAKTRAVNQPFLKIKSTTHSNKAIVRFSTALSHQINHPPGKNGVINSNYWSLVNNELEMKKLGIYKVKY